MDPLSGLTKNDKTDGARVLEERTGVQGKGRKSTNFQLYTPVRSTCSEFRSSTVRLSKVNSPRRISTYSVDGTSNR